MRSAGFAPAKVNLFLHVGPPEADGYHPLASLVAFADVGDTLTHQLSDRLSLTIGGRFGAGLTSEADNLVLRAVRALADHAGVDPPPPLGFHLDKALPVAAGLGGGSSDAGAALRLLRDAMNLPYDDDALAMVAAGIGADGPMCLHARAAWAGGRGDVLTFAPRLPPLAAVLINPDTPSPTGDVYRAYDRTGPRAADMPSPPADWSAASVTAWLHDLRNDLETPATALQPVIGEALEEAKSLTGARLARMSGSGATVFALFDDADTAARAASDLSVRRPGWWVEAATLS